MVDHPHRKSFFSRVLDLRPSRVFLALFNVPPIKRGIIRAWYQCLSVLDKEANMVFMNYGYAPLVSGDVEIELRREDEVNRYCIQLYQKVAGAIDLQGKDVLEVGCGRGGGASFITRYLRPRSMVGLDFSSKAVAFCRRHYPLEGLSFTHGDAEDLPFASGSFDVVVNIESSHCYGSMGRFLQEVARVLRPTGYFLFADFRSKGAVDLLREQLRQSGLRIVEEERITPHIFRALELDNARKLDLIQRKVPWFLRSVFRKFAGIEGGPAYEKFRTGEWEYLRFVLQKGVVG